MGAMALHGYSSMELKSRSFTSKEPHVARELQVADPCPRLIIGWCLISVLIRTPAVFWLTFLVFSSLPPDKFQNSGLDNFQILFSSFITLPFDAL
jgi:hypothetical protein